MLVNDKGIVVGNNKDVATAYQEGLANGFGEDRCDLFKKLLKAIITDNAEYTRDGKIKLKTTVKAIFDYHVDKKPMCFTCKSEEKYVSNVVDNFQNWIGEWDDEKISIHSTTPTSSFIIKDRALLIDFLLYFNYKQFNGSYSENIKKFNKILDNFNYGSLYLMNYQEFCVMSAFKFAQNGEDVYARFLDIYNNEDFKKAINSFDTPSEEDWEVYTVQPFTEQMIRDFNNDVKNYGSKVDLQSRRHSGENMSLYQFVDCYKDIFGRVHLSSYKLLCFVIKKFNNSKILKKLLNDVCESTCQEFLSRYRGRLINERKRDYYAEKVSTNDGSYVTIFETTVAKEVCKEFLKNKNIKCYNPEKQLTDDPYFLDKELKLKLNDECEKFFFAELEKGLGARAQNEMLSEASERDDLLWDPVFYRSESVTKELLVWVLILCLRSDVLKKYISGRSALGNPDKIGDIILNKFNEMLTNVGMSSLNAKFSKEEFLLVNAIYHVDYKKVYTSEEVYYPYREYVFNEIFSNMTVKDKVGEFIKVKDLLL